LYLVQYMLRYRRKGGLVVPQKWWSCENQASIGHLANHLVLVRRIHTAYDECAIHSGYKKVAVATPTAAISVE